MAHRTSPQSEEEGVDALSLLPEGGKEQPQARRKKGGRGGVERSFDEWQPLLSLYASDAPEREPARGNLTDPRHGFPGFLGLTFSL